ncbi:beta-1,3-galactosyltransferase 5-like [Acropora millepora]|uniref:beta-1,3-galactosyltransferase 5-like n=1 Tax=Acropora millepora TaxID=45264 RepID=UPI001CF4F0D0|nr:beta-1,3-galactosyltransferase 5-like [Acropora millepora]
MKIPYVNGASHKLWVKRAVNFFFAAVVLTLIITFAKECWCSARSRELRSVAIYSRTEVIPESTEGLSEKSFPSEESSTMNQEIVSVQHKSSLTTRTACQQHYFLLILVASAPAYFDRRRDIRQTWASDSSLNPRWKTIFMLGQTRNSNHSKQLLREEAYYGDLIRADYFEDYWNQTLKIEMGFEWAAKYCNFTFLLKADDDVFVNTLALLSLLENTKTPKTGLYLGHLYKHPRVQREGKWLVTQEEYNETHYPDFCAGPGYILSQDVIVSFVDIFDTIPKFKIDDAYVGMLAKEAGVIPRHHAGFQTPPYVSMMCVLLTDTVVRHSAVGSCLRDLFRKAMPDLNVTAVKK